MNMHQEKAATSTYGIFDTFPMGPEWGQEAREAKR
jgi:hypothetical protein